MKNKILLLIVILIFMSSISYKSYASTDYLNTVRPEYLYDPSYPYWIVYEHPTNGWGAAGFSKLPFWYEESPGTYMLRVEGPNSQFIMTNINNLTGVGTNNPSGMSNVFYFSYIRESNFDIYDYYQTKIYFHKNNVRSNDLPFQIDNPNEFVNILLPREDFKTIDKFIKYTINYSIRASTVNDINISIRNEDGLNFDDDPKIKSYSIVSHDTITKGEYIDGLLQVLVQYNDVIGPVGIDVTVKNNPENRQLFNERNCELVEFVDENGDGIDDNTGQDQYQNIDEEQILITKPGINSKTSSKLVPLNFTLKIKANDYAAVQESINILYLNPLTNQYENLLESDILDWNGIYNSKNQLLPLGMFQYGEYITLNYTVNLLFNSDFIGKIPLKIEATSNTTNKILTKNHIFEIVAFVDANGDGIDDNTWENYDPNPQLPDYGDDDLSLEDLLVTVKKSIPFIKDGLLLISSLMTVTLSFLPPEVMALIISIITILGVTTIIKLIRG